MKKIEFGKYFQFWQLFIFLWQDFIFDQREIFVRVLKKLLLKNNNRWR